MYSLDVNLLKDRYLEDASRVPKETKRQPLSLEKQLPLLLGGAALILLPALAGLGVLFLNWQVSSTQESLESLDSELERLNIRNLTAGDIEKKIEDTQKETKALASAFDYIQSWTAIITDIQSRVPPGVRIFTIEQEKLKDQKKSTSKTSKSKKSTSKESTSEDSTQQKPEDLPGLKVTITGYAMKYQDANDFLLALQASRLLNGQKTQLESAKLIELPDFLVKLNESEIRQLQQTGVKEIKTNAPIQIKFPQIVEYKIDTELAQTPASDLIGELSSKGGTGLVTRLKTLGQQGEIKP